MDTILFRNFQTKHNMLTYKMVDGWTRFYVEISRRNITC